jgi:AcrR family transcriptional regulator
MARVAKNKQNLRSEATRQRLVAAARTMFAESGYAGVGTEQIVQAAGVTRGALYHQFRDKADLFAAVAETVQAEVAHQITSGAQTDGPVDPMTALHAGVRRFLEACADPAVERILLLDGPAVLGWQAWRDLSDSYGLGLLQHGLQAAMDGGAISPQPVVPLAHVLIGALDECALYVARAADPAAARQQCTAILQQLLDGLRPHPAIVEMRV